MVAIARVLAGGVPVGGAFLTTFDQVFTASHVVNDWLGRDQMTTRSPLGDGHEVDLDFPFMSNAPCKAEIARWTAPKKEDVATLVIGEGVPDGLTPCLIVPDISLSVGQRVRVYGFPAGYDQGVWTYGVLGHRTSANQMQLNLELELTVKAGFSGCPVFLEEKDAVVGMIVTADEGNKLAFMVPSDYLVRRLKFETPRKGTNLWEVNHFRRATLTALLNDLYGFEGEGYDDTVCETVRSSLGEIANSISVVDDRAFWERSLDDEIEDFVEVYKKWNGCPKDKSGAETRNQELRKLRAKRKSISSKIRDAQGLFGGADDQQMMREIFTSVRRITTRHPSMFRNLERSVRALDSAK